MKKSHRAILWSVFSTEVLLIAGAICFVLTGCFDDKYNPKVQTDSEKIIFQDGRKAREADIPAEKNPYINGNNLHRNWRDGWIEMDKEIKAAEERKRAAKEAPK